MLYVGVGECVWCGKNVSKKWHYKTTLFLSVQLAELQKTGLDRWHVRARGSTHVLWLVAICSLLFVFEETSVGCVL